MQDQSFSLGDRSLRKGSSGAPESYSPSVSEWLESSHLSRIVHHVALRHEVRPEDIPDIFQEVCVSLLHKGTASRVNARWVFKTVASRVADYHRGLRWDLEDHQRVTAQDVSRVHGADPELLLLVRSMATFLPPRLKALYILRYRLGLKQSEVAQRLGTTRAGVRHLEQQCLERLTRGRV